MRITLTFIWRFIHGSASSPRLPFRDGDDVVMEKGGNPTLNELVHAQSDWEHVRQEVDRVKGRLHQFQHVLDKRSVKELREVEARSDESFDRYQQVIAHWKAETSS